MAPNVAPTLFLVLIFLSCRCSTGARDANSRLPVKTIKTAGGDVFDCVDIHKQPAFDHPSLKDHKILMKPAGAFFDDFPTGGPKINDTFNMELENMEGCPVGTVPVHRLSNSNLTGYDGNFHVSQYDPNVVHLWATREAHKRNYFGASSKMSIYAVEKVGADQQSSVMIGLKNGDAKIFARGEIRAGWKVAPALFGDDKTRLFIEWSGNGGETSCVNLLCPGFIQTNHNIYLGGILTPLSTYQGTQYYIYLNIFKDERNNWWVSIVDMQNVIGYWPGEIFTNFGYATMAYFGGGVSCRKEEFCPPMGSGHMPRMYDPHNDRACSMQRVQVVGPDHHWGGLGYSKQSGYTSRPHCYTVGDYSKDVHAYKFAFGGGGCRI